MKIQKTSLRTLVLFFAGLQSQAAIGGSVLNFHCQQSQLPEMTLSLSQSLKKLTLTSETGITEFAATGVVDKESYSFYQDHDGIQKIKVLVRNDQVSAMVKVDQDVDAHFPDGVALTSLCLRRK